SSIAARARSNQLRVSSNDFGSHVLDRTHGERPASKIDDGQSIHHQIGTRNASDSHAVRPVRHAALPDLTPALVLSQRRQFKDTSRVPAVCAEPVAPLITRFAPFAKRRDFANQE